MISFFIPIRKGSKRVKNKNIKQMVSPYGDGHASQKIVKIIKTHFMQSEHIN